MEKSKNKKIRILFVHANNEDVGGADFCLFKMVSSLDRNDYEPLVILRKDTSITSMYRKAGLNVKLLPIVRLQRTKNIFKLILTAFQFPLSVSMLMFQIIKNDVDIVHSNDLLDFSGSIAAKLTGRRSMQHLRMIVFKNPAIRKAVSKLLLIGNDNILCVSRAVADWFFGENSVKNKNVVVLYDWLDMNAVGHNEGSIDIRKELLLPPETILIGMVGRLEWWKGHHVFVKSAKKVLNSFPDVHFVTIGGKVRGRGRETYGDELREIAASDGTQLNIHFLGERKHIYSIISQFDIAVHCSVKPDPFPGVVLEAMECSKPVIGARGGGVPEQVEENISGLLFEPGDSDELAKKIIYLLENKNIVAQMGRKARSSIHTRFDKEKIMNQLENIYNSLVE